MSRLPVRPIRAWKDKLITTAILLAVVVGMKLLSVPCPLLALTGLPCPTCGMTRAWTSVLSLDFSTAFSYHPLFWTVPLVYVCFLYDGQLFKTTWCNIVFYIFLGTAFAGQWLTALIGVIR